MAKEKVAMVEHSKKETVFYYEIIGIICVLISLIAIARFGLAGMYLALIFKLAFGDWYFVFIILLLLYGVRTLIIHEPLRVKSMRFFGILLICLGLLTVSHLSYHKYIMSYQKNHYKLTVTFYFDAFKTMNFDQVGGGGLIGATIFYLFYGLLAEAGAIIIASILIYIGVAFVFQKTVSEFTVGLLMMFKKAIAHGLKLRRTLKYEIKQYENDNQPSFKIKPDWFKEIDYNKAQDEEVAEFLLNEITRIVNKHPIFYSAIEKTISPHIIIITITSYTSINLQSLHILFKKELTYPFLLRYDQSHVYLEFSKKYPLYTSFKQALLENSKESVLLGTGSNNQPINFSFNENFLIIGKHTNNYLKTIYLLSKYHFQKHTSNLYWLADTIETSLISKIFPYSYLFEMLKEAESRLQLLNQLAVKGFNDYNQKKLIRKFRQLSFLSLISKRLWKKKN